ncbi:MAG: histidine phosphatase family protein [Firmicutes bacterium]|nr:histidine phosphatase family protein [Bacillota bacterium]
MTRIFLVRHGETSWNMERRYQGNKDVLLSKEGRRQATLLARSLRGRDIARIYSSDLRRALETAAIVGAHLGVPVFTEPALREANFGVWEGCTQAEVAERFPEVLASWRHDSVNTRVPGGETAFEVQERAYQALLGISGTHPGETVTVVSHGGPIKAALCRLLHLDLCHRFRMVIDNASICTIDLAAGDGKLVSLNDTCHLKLPFDSAGLDGIVLPDPA